MQRFGAQNNFLSSIDSLAKESILFTNLQATGTRTIRGIEALTLCIPPTPGRSIVKRENNQNLFTIGEVFKQTVFEPGGGDFESSARQPKNGGGLALSGRFVLPRNCGCDGPYAWPH